MDRKALIDEALRICEDARYSAKGHFNAAARWTEVHYWLGIPATVLSAVAGVSALSEFDNHDVIAGGLAIGVAALSAVGTFLNPSGQAATHQSFGNRFNSLKNRARVTAQIDGESGDPDEVRNDVMDLGSERDDLNEAAPAIPRHAFESARAGIEDGEATYAVDEEPKRATHGQ